MESLSVASILAWQQQNLAMQVGVSVLKKSMDVQAQSALFLLESVSRVCRRSTTLFGRTTPNELPKLRTLSSTMLKPPVLLPM
jgi:hypothetical protein